MACILIFSMTACGSTRSQYVWHDLGSHEVAEPVKVSPPAQKWGSDAETAESADPTLAPGYLINLHSPDDAKMNGDYRVDIDGNVALPYNMSVNAAGLTVTQLQKRLGELYKPYFKTAPMVRVKLQERKPMVDVRGLVEKPGRYAVDKNASLDQVIAEAGGYLKDNMPRFVRIQKGSKSMVLDLNQYMNKGDNRNQIVAWVGGETIDLQKDVYSSVPASGSRQPITVFGEVRKPGDYLLKPGMDFVDLLSQANGFTLDADLGQLELIRRTNNRLLAYDFSWKDFNRAPMPMEGDVLYVHGEAETRTERRVFLGIGALTAVATIITSAVLIHDSTR